MITEIYVNGYRSLSSFQVPVSPGLNIVVGPNGGGKTNILSFFEFLSRLISRPVDEAVSSQGGIGRVFSRLPNNVFQRSLSAHVTGVIRFRGASGRASKLWYTWQFEIVSSETYDEISYSSQKLFIDLKGKPKKLEDSDLVVALGSADRFAHLQVQRLIATKLQPFFQSLPLPTGGKYVGRDEANRLLSVYGRSTDLSRNCIINALPNSEVYALIARDIRGGETYNFVPEVCKQPDDSARPAVIEKNGAGLAATLYRLEKNPSRQLMARSPAYIPSGSSSQRTIDKLRGYIGLISDTITGIKTEKNPIDNKISVFLNIAEESEDVAFPLAHCSDGTVKWIALITTLLTAKAGFAIEEPENFLHPNVQKEFVNIVRTETANSPIFTMVTTHSESLLNEASPSEVMLVWMENGITVAKRVSDPEALVAEINRTGFGLGYYYASGGLQPEDLD